MRRGDTLATLHHRAARGVDAALAALADAVEVAAEASPPRLVLGVIGRP